MAMESAKSFVKKQFEDDEFIKELCKKGVLTNNKNKDKNSKEEGEKELVKAAKEKGFDFTIEEYKKATEEYFKTLGLWRIITTLYHFGKVIKATEKEMKKNQAE